MNHALAFVLGVLYELVYIAWIRFSVAQKPLLSAVFSMLVGAISVYAMTGVYKDMSTMPALILGYGVGSYVVAKIGSK